MIIIHPIESLALCFSRYIAGALHVDHNRRSCRQNENEDRLKVKLYDWRSMISFYCVVTYTSAASVPYIGIISEKEDPSCCLAY